MTGMPLAAAVIMMVLTAWCWRASRTRRVKARREKFRAMMRGRFMIAAFGIVSGIAQALAYRFGGQFGESLDEAWDRWFGVVNGMLGVLAATTIIVLTTLISHNELTSSPIAYNIGLLIPLLGVASMGMMRSTHGTHWPSPNTSHSAKEVQ